MKLDTHTLAAGIPGIFEDSSKRWASKSLLASPSTWKFVTIAWVVIGIVTWLLQYGYSSADPATAQSLERSATRLVYAALWWCVTIFVIWICEHVPVEGISRPIDWVRMAFHAVVGWIVEVTWCVLAYYINLAVISGWRPEGVLKMIQTQSLAVYSYYVGLVFIMHGILFTREHREQELRALRRANALAAAELHLLKMELQPHFLFNALNSISSLMHQDVRAANEALVLVSDMLRIALDNAREVEVTMREELETLSLYVQIQQIRFQDRLKVEWHVEPEVERAMVPHMILQPLIENSIKHGIEVRSMMGKLIVEARRDGEWLELLVQDNGRGLSYPPSVAGHGLGISNTRERLQHLYGFRHSFELRNAPGGGAAATIRIPLRYAENSVPQRGNSVQSHVGQEGQEIPYAAPDSGSDR